jgi:hypothetical protein
MLKACDGRANGVQVTTCVIRTLMAATEFVGSVLAIIDSVPPRA